MRTRSNAMRGGSARQVGLKTRLYVIAGALVAIAMCASDAFAQGKVTVIATTEDMAAIARDVGGDRVSVEALARG